MITRVRSSFFKQYKLVYFVIGVFHTTVKNTRQLAYRLAPEQDVLHKGSYMSAPLAADIEDLTFWLMFY